MSVSCIPDDVQITNKVIVEILEDYDQDFHIDPDNVRLEVAGQQERPWLLVERKVHESEVWFTLHRSLESVKGTVLESFYDVSGWVPDGVYNTKSGASLGFTIGMEIEGE